jgi:hypothetical protein
MAALLKVFVPQIILSIDSVTPQTPVERTQTVVAFTLVNETVEPTTGAVTSNWGTSAASVQGLPPGGTHRGSLSLTTPAAGSDQLRIWYTADVPNVETPGPVAEADIQVAVAGTYTVTIDKIHIDNTRAVHNDTDYVHLALQGGKEGTMLSAWKRLGDVNNGDHGVALTLGPVTLGPTDSLAFAYEVINHGNFLDVVKDFFDKVSGAAAQVLGDIYVGTDWSKGDELTRFINKVQFADCDGYTAVDGIGLLDGARLSAWTSQVGLFQVTLAYPPSNIDPDTYDRLYKSAVGCGSTSKYSVSWTVRRTSF